MPLITIRPKNKIPVSTVKAGEKPMIFQLSQPNSERAHFPAFPAFLAVAAGVAGLISQKVVKLI